MTPFITTMVDHKILIHRDKRQVFLDGTQLLVKKYVLRASGNLILIFKNVIMTTDESDTDTDKDIFFILHKKFQGNFEKQEKSVRFFYKRKSFLVKRLNYDLTSSNISVELLIPAQYYTIVEIPEEKD